MLYKAFMSYSHAADGKLAPAVQSGLHQFARPWYRLRALRVFRDKTTLAVTPALWPAIERALDESEFFILMASPGSAQSQWVQREIGHWLQKRSPETLLIVLTDGALVWDGAAEDFDWSRTTALPGTLRGAFKNEPLYLDLHWAQTEEHLSLRDPRFRNAIAQLGSTLHGRPLDELVGEDVRLHRNARRLAWGAVVALVALTVASLIAAFVAVHQRNLAEERLRIALSRQLSVDALGSGERLDQGLLLAVEANLRARTAEAATTLKTLLDRSSRLQVILHQPIKAFAFNPTGESLALALADGSIQRLDTTEFQPLGRPLRPGTDWRVTLPDSQLGQPAGLPMTDVPGTATWLAFTPDMHALLSVHPSAGYHPPLYTLFQWDLDGDRSALLRVDRAHLATLSPNGDTVALLERWAGESRVLFWNSVERRVAAPPIEYGRDSPIWVVFSPAGDRMVVGYASGGTQLWSELHSAPRAVPLDVDAKTVASAVFDDAGTAVFFGTDSGDILRRRIGADEPAGAPLKEHDDRIVGLGFTARDHTLTSISEDGTIVIWYLDRPQPVGPISGRLAPPIGAAVFSRAGLTMAALQRRSAKQFGALELWTRPQPRGFADAAEAFTQLHEGRIAGEELPVTLAAGVEEATSEYQSLMGVGSLRWSFNSAPLAFDLQGTRLATMLSGGGLAIWRLDERRSLGWQMPEGMTGFAAAALSRDGRTLAWGAGDRVERWDLAAGRRLEALTVENGIASAVAIAPDGKTLAFGEYDMKSTNGRIRIVDAATRQATVAPFELADVPGAQEGGRGWVMALAFDPSGRRLVSDSYSGDVIIWDLAARTSVLPLTESEPLPPVLDLAVHPSRPLLALPADKSVILVDLASGRLLPRPAIEAPQSIISLAFHPAGDILASGLEDGSVHFWDLATGRTAGTPLTGVGENSLPTSVAYDREGSHLAVAYRVEAGSVVRLWDLALRAPSLPDFAAPGGERLKTLISPAADHLVWASEGSGPIIWDATLDQWIASACRIANRPLDASEWRRFLPSEPYRPTCGAVPAAPKASP